MTVLDVQHVQKIYSSRFKAGQLEALKDIHFTVEEGEYVAIMGESGSGKSIFWPPSISQREARFC